MPSDADQLLQVLDTAQRGADGGGLAAARVLALGDTLAISEAHVTNLVGQLQDAGLLDVRWGGEVRVSERGRARLRDLAGGAAGSRVINAVFQGPATGVNFGDGARQTFSTGDASPVQGGDHSTLDQHATQQWGASVADLAVALANLRAALSAGLPEARAAGADLEAAVRDVIAAAQAARPGPPVATSPEASPMAPAAPQAPASPGESEPAPDPAPAVEVPRSALGRAIDRVTDLCGRLGTMGENVTKLAPYLPPIVAAATMLGRLAGLPIP